MTALKLVKNGDALGVILPKEALAKLGVQKGDTLFLSETPEGFQLSANNSDHEAKMVVARGLMKKWHNVLAELAR